MLVAVMFGDEVSCVMTNDRLPADKIYKPLQHKNI